MGYQSQAGQVGFKTQAAKGVFANPGAAAPNAGVFVRTRSGALGVNRDLLIPDPEIGGNRDVPDAYLGSASFAGEYDIYVRMEALAVLMRAALGDVASAPRAAPDALAIDHVITPAALDIPWLSIEEAVSTFDVFRYTDGKVNTLHLEVDANGYLMGTAGLIALTQLAGAARTAVPDWDTTPMIVGNSVQVLWGGAALPAKSWSFDLTNNIEDDDYRLGSIGLGDAVEKRREVTAGVTIRPNDNAIWREAVYGSAAATSPIAGAAAKDELHIIATTYELIAGTVVPYTMDLTIPEATIAPFELEPSGDDVIEHSLEIRALRPDPAVDLMVGTITNAVAALP